MSDQSRTTATNHGYGGRGHESAQSSHQTLKFLTAATIGISLLLLLMSGLTLTGTVIGLILFTPVLIVFSPILVPAGVVLLLAATGLMFSGGCGVAAATALTWIYNYVAGKNPPGADKLDYARMVIADKARDVTERAKEYGHYGQQGRVHEATQGF